MSYADAGVVFVVDDVPSVRSSLKVLVGRIGLQVESFYTRRILWFSSGGV